MKSSQGGFTIIELAVIGTIVAILTLVAVPYYLKYKERSRQTEAKIALVSIFTAEKGFIAQDASYTLCLAKIGFVPDTSSRYYASGFSGADTSECGLAGTAPCALTGWAPRNPTLDCEPNTADQTYFNSTARIGSVMATGNDLAGSFLKKSTFKAVASGSIGLSILNSNLDSWSIDQDKVLLHEGEIAPSADAVTTDTATTDTAATNTSTTDTTTTSTNIDATTTVTDPNTPTVPTTTTTGTTGQGKGGTKGNSGGHSNAGGNSAAHSNAGGNSGK